MRTFRYSKTCPQGMIFDTVPGMPDPHLPPDWKQRGWVEHFGEIPAMTSEQVVEAAVKAELATQSKDRPELEREYDKKHGHRPSSLIKDKTLVKAYDERVKK